MWNTARRNACAIAQSLFNFVRVHLFSPRQFLRTRQAVLVHFSTVMSGSELPFPEDLHNAMNLKGEVLSFSTIQLGDTSPHRGRGGAEGSVGLLIDISK